MKIKIKIEYDKTTGMYCTSAPFFNDTASFGETEDLAISNLMEAIELMLEPVPSKCEAPEANVVYKEMTFTFA